MDRARKKQRKTTYERVGQIKIPWRRFGDGRTAIDLRSIHALPERERKVRTFANHREAIAEAHRIALELHNSGSEAQILTAEDRAAYARACSEAKRFGYDLLTAIGEWREARELLKGTTHRMSAAVAAGDIALRRTVVTTGDVVLQFLGSKKAQDLDGRYARDLRTHCQAFAAAFPGDIAAIRSGDVQLWLDGRFDEATGEWVGGLRKAGGAKLGAVRRNHVLENIAQLFKFARKQTILPDKITAPQQVEKVRNHSGDIGFFLVEEVQTLLDHVEHAWLPWLAIAAFSGIRTEEIALSYHAAKRKDVLRWEDFDWEAREINVRAKTAKTGQPRRCPILDNLWSWLAPWREAKATGLVVKGSIDKFRKRFKRQLARLSEESEIGERLIAWPHNALRHSYGSYRMAMIQNMHQLAYEMGDSVSMIQRHYHNPRPQSEARKYFQIFRNDSAPNVIQLTLPMARTASRK